MVNENLDQAYINRHAEPALKNLAKVAKDMKLAHLLRQAPKYLSDTYSLATAAHFAWFNNKKGILLGDPVVTRFNDVVAGIEAGIRAVPDARETLRVAEQYAAKMVADGVNTALPPSNVLRAIGRTRAALDGKSEVVDA